MARAYSDGLEWGPERTERAARRAARSDASGVAGLVAQGHRVDQVRVAQLAQRLTLDQAYALARQAEHLTRLAQAERLPVLEPVAQRDDMALAIVEHLVDGAADLLAEQLILDLVEPGVGGDLLDQGAEIGVI